MTKEPTQATFVRLRVLQSLFEGQRAQAILNEAGIASMLTSYGDTAMDGLYQAQKGWGEIRVAQERRDEAARLLDENLPRATEVEADELERQALSSNLPEEKQKRGMSTFEWVVTLVLIVFGAALVYLLAERWS